VNDIVLKTEGLVKRFGGITATDHVSLNVTRGARHALIGPNGAGKTTLINLMTGVLDPTEGRITLEGRTSHGLRRISACAGAWCGPFRSTSFSML
jgi:branched-chain amino acid transport system ATP-binding protein